MPDRRPARSGSRAPGRDRSDDAGTRRSRNAARSRPGAIAGQSRTWGFTRRSLVLACIAVLALVAITPNLKAYFDQQQQISELEATVAAQKADVGSLDRQIARWDDPAFIRAQARGRLLYVMPGETRYRVTDSQGRFVTNPDRVGEQLAERAPRESWFSKLWGSVEGADSAP